MRKGGKHSEAQRVEAELNAAGQEQRLVWNGERWTSDEQSPGSDGEERTRFSITPLHVGVGLALFAVGVMVPVAAAGLTWWAFRRNGS